MGVSFNDPNPMSPMERLYDITFRDPSVPQESTPIPLVHVQADEQADIDISGDAFDFVRSIRVYHIQYRQHENRDGDCNRATRRDWGPTACRATTDGQDPPWARCQPHLA
jgi:hypothetical protein